MNLGVVSHPALLHPLYLPSSMNLGVVSCPAFLIPLYLRLGPLPPAQESAQ